MKAIENFFLSGFAQSTYFEKRKASYLFYIILTALFFLSALTIGQLVFGMGIVYWGSNFIMLGSVLLTLYLFKQRKIDPAGHVMCCSIMLMVGAEAIMRDAHSTDPAMRYRLYMTMVSLLGVFFLVLSFFRDKAYVLWYGLAFELILFIHAAVIYKQIRNVPKMGLYVWEHLLTLTFAMTLLTAISNWLLGYMEALFQQNTEYAERFKSQKEQLEKMVEERTHDLKASNQNLSEFAYIVSHDLKEPLRTISGFVTLIKRELDKQGLNENEIAEYLSFVNRGTSQMELLINDILQYSKLNVVDKNFEEVPVSEVLKEVKSRLAKAIYESEGKLYISNAMNVKGQAQLLVQLFQNLISNAIKYRSPERELKITIGCSREVDVVRYFVKDNGIGIDEKHFETIFKAFRRLHSKVDYEGTGVGLAICKKIVEIHGGDIWVESAEGAGSTFWFTLHPALTAIPETTQVV